MASVYLRIAAGFIVFATAAAIPACGGTAEHGTHVSSTAAAGQQDPQHNDNDITFAENMIPHHQQAIDLAALVPDRSSNPAVIKMAAAIAAQQEPEVNALRAMLVQWQVNSTGNSHHAMGQGMVDDATMARLKTLKGAEFDTLWLQSMIAHHQGAIEMAKAEITQGQDPDMIAMANNIVVVQQDEIGQLKQILGG